MNGWPSERSEERPARESGRQQYPVGSVWGRKAPGIFRLHVRCHERFRQIGVTMGDLRYSGGSQVRVAPARRFSGRPAPNHPWQFTPSSGPDRSPHCTATRCQKPSRPH